MKKSELTKMIKEEINSLLLKESPSTNFKNEIEKFKKNGTKFGFKEVQDHDKYVEDDPNAITLATMISDDGTYEYVAQLYKNSKTGALEVYFENPDLDWQKSEPANKWINLRQGRNNPWEWYFD